MFRMVLPAALAVWILSIPTRQLLAAQPSFDCAKAHAEDERTICSDDKLAQLDQAISIAFDQVKDKEDSTVIEDVRDILRKATDSRHRCGNERLCILDNQVDALSDLQSEGGAKVPLPPWIGNYRIRLFKARGDAPTDGLPRDIGKCTITKVAGVSTRFGEELKEPKDETDSSGSAVTFADGGYQVSYSFEWAIADSKIGDETLVCLLSIPTDCPPGDDRGKFYVSTNIRTGGTWSLPDSQHMCGGA